MFKLLHNYSHDVVTFLHIYIHFFLFFRSKRCTKYYNYLFPTYQLVKTILSHFLLWRDFVSSYLYLYSVYISAVLEAVRFYRNANLIFFSFLQYLPSAICLSTWQCPFHLTSLTSAYRATILIRITYTYQSTTLSIRKNIYTLFYRILYCSSFLRY